MNDTVKIELLEKVVANLSVQRATSFQECIKWAREEFETQFVNRIKQLLFQFPPGMLTSSGKARLVATSAFSCVQCLIF